MNVTAKLSQYRQAPRKVRLVANLVKGKSVEFALVELGARSKRAAPVFEKLIKSALASARVQGLNEKTLIVKEIRVDKGPVLKRSRPRAQGRAFPIHKHTSHIVVTLSDGMSDNKEDTKAVATKQTDTKASTDKKPKAVTAKPVTKKVAAKAK